MGEHVWVVIGHVHVEDPQALLNGEELRASEMCKPMLCCLYCQRPFSPQERVLPCEKPVAYLRNGDPVYARDN